MNKTRINLLIMPSLLVISLPNRFCIKIQKKKRKIQTNKLAGDQTDKKY